MGPSTPWKSSSQFLDPPGSQRNPVPGVIPPDKGVEPNVLRGLGSINSGIWGEDRLSDNGHAPVYNGPQPGMPPIARPTRTVNDPKDRQAISPTAGDAPPSNINNNSPPSGNHYGGNPPTGGGNPFPGRGGGHPGGSGGNPPGGGGNPFSGGGNGHFGAGGGGNPPGGGGNSPGGSGNPFPGGGHFPHDIPSFPLGPPPGGGGDGPPGAGGGAYDAPETSHNRGEADL